MHASRPGSTHTYAKRSVALNPPIIAGIVVVVVAFNFILAVSWCILRDRKKVKKLHKRRISVPVDCEKYENSPAFALTTGAAVRVPEKGKKDVRGEQGGNSYYELIRALQAHPTSQTPSSPTRVSRSSSSNSSSEERPGLKKFILRPQDMKGLNGVPVYPKGPGSGQRQSARHSRILGVPGRVDLRRANSVAETASVYSSASAPIDYHEQLFRTQPFALDPTAPNSAPAWISQMPKPPAPAVLFEEFTAEIEVPLSPTPTGSISDRSDASTVVQHQYSPPSPIAVSPISVPASSTPSLVRTRTYSNPTAPPQVRWLANSDASESPSSKPSVRSKRPTSISSLSTILSLKETTRVPAVVIAPLNIRRRSTDLPWRSVDMTRSTPLSPFTSHPPPPPALPPAASLTTPSIPARSPRRPLPSASVEHLPVSR
ncbi:hypothetical protein C8Q74DRAFT_1367822 [Fomes fomentarius]|nr:hypothetical protein C8Q74DRAFT_1367822 [Fomes fomentarius]